MRSIVLRLWRDQVSIVLCPGRVIAVRRRAGLHRQIVAKEILQHSGQDWQAALAALDSLLKKDGLLKNPNWGNADANAVLSNHFVRFLLLPWNEVALTSQEKHELLQKRYSDVYGEPVANREFRVQEGGYGSPSLACAIERELLQQLQQVFAASTLKLRSIQPYLMTGFNACRNQLGHDAAWFVLTEPGLSCIALVKNSGWQLVRLKRTESEDWFAETMMAIEREKLRANIGTENGNLYLFSPEMSKLNPDKRNTHELQHVQPDACKLLKPEEMQDYAMAMAGIRR